VDISKYEDSLCKVCGKGQLYKNKYMQHVFLNKQAINLVRCAECGLIQAHPFPIFDCAHYDGNYYEQWQTALENVKNGRKELWRQRADWVSINAPDMGLLVDVGCGLGEFHDIIKPWLPPYVVIYETEKSEYVRKKRDVPDSTTSIYDETTDAVTMWHVLEHTTYPDTEIKEVKRILKDSGMLFIAVPNSGCIIYKFKSDYLNLKSNEPHALWFNHQSLKYLLENNGFEVQEISPDFFYSKNQ